MPAHKNQHFVPRCALKPFSLDGNGKAINLFNIKSKLAIENAPVKGQCARDYLYAKEDLEAEQLLTKMEGQYARIVALLSDARVLSEDDVGALKFLVLIQSRRTELAIQQIRDFTKSMADAVYARAPDRKPVDTSTDRQLMYLSMRMAARAVDYIRDLKLVIFRNKTTIDFVTSDNPATMTNRFHFQKLKSNKFGLSNSGAMFSMPLSPRLSTMCYDTGTYSVPNASGTQFVDLTKDIDATALNQLQYLSASKNIYFRNLPDAERIKSELESFAEKRAKAAPITRIYVRDDSATSVVGRLRDPKTGRMEKYREGTPEEEQTARETLAATSFEFAEPFIWLSKLKFRDKPRYYNNGTAIGYVRKAEWLRKGGRP
jgi:Protein of unknown function (DUF4238)